MRLIETIDRMKEFHKDWTNDSNPELNFNDVTDTLENAILELEKFRQILDLIVYNKRSKSYASTALSEIRAISIEKAHSKVMADHDPSWMILDECKELDLLPSEPTLEMMCNKTKAILIGGVITLVMITLITTGLMILINQL